MDNLLTSAEMARRIGAPYANFQSAIKALRVPGPTVEHGKRTIYRLDDIPAVKRAWKKLVAAKDRTGYYSVDQMCRKLRLNRTTVSYLIRTGHAPQPAKRVSNAMLYSSDQFPAVRTAYRNRAKVGQWWQRNKPEGFASVTDIARRVGVKRSVLIHRISNGVVPAPIHEFPGKLPGRYYSAAEAKIAEKALRRALKKRKHVSWN